MLTKITGTQLITEVLCARRFDLTTLTKSQFVNTAYLKALPNQLIFNMTRIDVALNVSYLLNFKLVSILTGQ